MRKLLLMVLCMLGAAYGQSVTGIITGTQCLQVATNGYGVVGILLKDSGTSWSGTIQPQVIVEDNKAGTAGNVQVTPYSSSTAQATITANGSYQASVSGTFYFQVCGNTVTNNASVTLTPVKLSARSSGGGGGSGTVTNTGGSLTSNAVVLGAGGNDTKVSTGITTNGASELDVGVAGTNGVLGLKGLTSGTATLTAPAVAGTTTNAVVSSNNITAPNLVAGTAADTVAGHMTSASGTQSGQIFFGSDAAVYILRNANNNLNINTTGSAGLTLNGNMTFGTGKGQHFNTQAANNDHAGVCTAASATTCTVTFTTAYASAPACTATDVTGNTTVSKVTPSTGSLIITTAASSSDAIDYICVGNPN